MGANIFPLYMRGKKSFNIFSLCAYKMNTNDFDIKKSYIEIGGKEFPIKYYFGKGIRISKRGYLNLYSAKIDYDKLTDLEIHNPINYHFITKDEDISSRFKYNLIYSHYGIGAHSKIHNYEDKNLCTYIRQQVGNGLVVTVRNRTFTDNDFWEILVAWLVSLFYIRSKVILLYEKNNSKYEESAAAVYEKLIDQGYPAYFILNKNSEHWANIKPKYRKNVIKSFTFKHYLYYFKCHKFIGTESLAHSMELRSTNRLINLKRFMMIKFPKHNRFVFLQHGVMYMVSLDSKERTAFIKGKSMPRTAKIVVSSELEAKHFTDLGGFDINDLYISGLPAYDKNIKNDDADHITIMPTWRPWDFNVLESDYKKSSYYKMIMNMIKSVPKKYKDKIYLLPHPLIKERFANTDLAYLIPDEISYDKVLEKTSLLITDYSSISYSAFYRGSNVIFCWMEKDECMEHYGAHLMLNEKNTFGDVCYDYKELGKLIEKNYLKPQTKHHKNNYSKIVEFHDGKNTERLVNFLKRDKII